jgi:DNA-binding MarR family transcriptional regulator
MSAPTFPELADTLGSLLRRPYQRLQARLYETLADDGFPEIRAAHSAVFRHLHTDGSRLTDLSAAAGMTKQSMSYLVESLTSSGYLTLLPDPADGRAKLVTLTTKGRRCMNAAIRISHHLESQAIKKLSKTRITELRRTLRDLDAIFGED